MGLMILKGSLLLAAAVQMAEVSQNSTDRSLADPAVGTRSSEVVSEGLAPGKRYLGLEGDLEVASPVLMDPEIQIDGRMVEAAWAQGAYLSGFTQYDPIEGIPATQETEVRVVVTADAIFFGIRAFDIDASGVRATLTPRDQFGGSDDYVRIVLDTFNDRRTAFVFQVNPLGVQGDGRWMEGQGRYGDPIDWNPDYFWDSAGRVGSRGYTVEVRIPLNSLRFPEAQVQDWGLQVIRRIQRNGFSQSWAPLTGETANKLVQSGTLAGLQGLRPGRMVDLNPVLTATRQGRWNDTSRSFAHSNPSGELGFNATYGITSILTLNATYNPDFSQVEADAGQIAVNERFALYFPEKRPFFLEGSEVFSMRRRLVYTRSIANPVGAAKLSGKVGPYSVAYIGALDQTGSGAGDPVVNLLRIKRDVGRSSTLGVVYTDRSVFGRSFNRVAGADARMVLGGRYTLELMAAGSADGAEGRPTEWGSLVSAAFRRSSRTFTVNASFEDVSRSFRAGSGFIRQVGITEAGARAGYTWRGGAGALVESWGPSLDLEGTWRRDDFWAGGGPQETEVQLGLRVSLRGNLGASLSLSRDSYAFDPQDYEGLFRGVVPGNQGSLVPAGKSGLPSALDLAPFSPAKGLFSGLLSVRFRGWARSWEKVGVSVGASWNETPLFTRGLPAEVGESFSGSVGFDLRPTGSLSVEVGLRHSSIFKQRDGSRFSSATIPRFQARYQFSRSLFVRAIGEYSSQSRGDVLDPVSGLPVFSCGETCSSFDGFRRYHLQMEGLVGFEPSPGTVVYLGYSRQMRDAESFGFKEVTPQADGLFLKLSYRFRM